MRRSAPAALLGLLLLAAAAPVRAAGPQLVRVSLGGAVTAQALQAAGLDLVGGRGAALDLLLWPGDEARLGALGAVWTVLDPDPGRTAAQSSRAELAAMRAGAFARPGAAPGFAHFLGQGSLGGFWTLQEMKDELDALVARDSDDVVAPKLDTLGLSLQGRPVWGLQIAKSVSGPDTRPVVFMNALTHAREPEGMQALFYFVEDLVKKYRWDPVAKYLLDHRRLYVVGCVNPDGYEYNREIYDSTGAFGFWRKNLRDNDHNHVTNNADGVDLNRNFGFAWGVDDVGSSPTPSSPTYRGTAAFSEPETRIQRDVVDALRPVTGLSFHTYSDLYVHAWSYAPLATADSLKQFEWDDLLDQQNGWMAGGGPRVLYAANGEFSDWTYGDTLLKPRAFTWTPEVGDPHDGFWPRPSRMAPLAAEILDACWVVDGIAGPWVRAAGTSVVEGAWNAGQVAHLSVRARDVGATGTAGPGLTATLVALDPRAEVLGGPVAYPTLSPFTSGDPVGGATFAIAAADTVTPGTPVRFLISFADAAGLACRDTLTLLVGTPTVVAADAGASLTPWTAAGSAWGVVSGDPVHPAPYITDSPNGIYNPGQNIWLTLNAPLDLSAGVRAWVLAQDRWGFETDYDGALLEASLDGATWAPLRGTRSVVSDSSDAAGPGRFILDGTRWLWGPDRFDLSAFAGGLAATAVRLRWRSVSDPATELDGLSFDSLSVLVFDPAQQPAPVAVGRGPAPAALAFAPPAPNPARGAVRFEFALPLAGAVRLSILDLQGRVRWSRSATIAAGAGGAPYAARFAWGWDLRDGRGAAVAPGVYLARLETPAGAAVRRFAVIR